MNELIKVTESNGKQAVSARELYERLGLNPTQYPRWYKTNITDNQFAIQDVDYQILRHDVEGVHGRPSQDFALSIDFAKRLSMLARTEAGEKIRNYFIEVERRMTRPVSTLDLLELSIRQLREQEQRVNQIENKVLRIEAAVKTRPDYFTIIGYATMHKIQIGLKMAASLGVKAAKICRDNCYEMDEIPDPRFGRVRMYPEAVLNTVFDRPL